MSEENVSRRDFSKLAIAAAAGLSAIGGTAMAAEKKKAPRRKRKHFPLIPLYSFPTQMYAKV